MDAFDHLIVAAALFAVALASGWLDRVFLTTPIVCLGAGFALDRMGLIPAAADQGLLRVLAEATLAVVLFGDAARSRPAALWRSARWAGRLLLIGMPLSLLMGTAVFAPLLPGWDVLAVMLLAALLVPTDAALSESLVAGDGLSERAREALAAESGLNDGLALPAIVFLGCAAVGYEHALTRESWVVFASEQVGYGLAVGAAGGVLGALALLPGRGRGVPAGAMVLTLVAVAYFGAVAVGGNGFVAVFVAGLSFCVATGRLTGEREAVRTRVSGFVAAEGALLTIVSFVYVGAALLPDALDRLQPSWVVGIAASLLLVRPAAVALAMLGTDADRRTRLTLGWFGPRGLATALFAVFALESFMALGHGPDILAIATLTVTASAVLHGVTALAHERLSRPARRRDGSAERA